MKVYEWTKNWRQNVPTTIGLGNFDGLHRGHIHLLHQVIRIAEKRGELSSVLLFSEHTNERLNQSGHSYLTSLDDKLRILDRLGIQAVFLVHFDDWWMHLPPEVFLREVLVETLFAKSIVVGEDYRFGHRAMGNVDYLREQAVPLGYDLTVVEDLKAAEQRISSTRIKELLDQGLVGEANQLLGYPYPLRGHVIHGAARGRQMGFPTANLQLDFPYHIPREGVYYVKARVQGGLYDGLLCIGDNPTFQGAEHSIETYLDQFHGDIYGAELTNYLLEYLRPNYRFHSMEELVQQMEQDKVQMQSRSCRDTIDMLQK